MTIRRSLPALFLLLSCAAPLLADMAVPPKLQAAIFQKIFTYDHALAGNTRLLVVFPDKTPGQRDEIVRAFQDNGIKAAVVKLSALKEALAGANAANVVYLLPGSASDEVNQLCISRKALPISGDAVQAEAGTVAVAVGALEGKPKIFVHLGLLKASQHELAPDLLKLAKVIA